jgi:hypothetical protein
LKTVIALGWSLVLTKPLLSRIWGCCEIYDGQQGHRYQRLSSGRLSADHIEQNIDVCCPEGFLNGLLNL